MCYTNEIGPYTTVVLRLSNGGSYLGGIRWSLGVDEGEETHCTDSDRFLISNSVDIIPIILPPPY